LKRLPDHLSLFDYGILQRNTGIIPYRACARKPMPVSYRSTFGAG
jgi:hypothetical protein